eukprot:GFUD01037955.1.p1 GENE.GFUD01037955.1~~GFUD01037955.1.p1  ORF type:complete len:294 (+),score=99.82 GFUD01037955.1:41-922(+)
MSDINCELLALPSEVFEHVCSFLSPHSVCQLELTCSLTRQAVETASVWRRILKQLARETSREFVCSMMAFAKEKEGRLPGVYKIIFGFSIKFDTMVEEIQTWLNHWSLGGSDECDLSEDGSLILVKNWNMEVLAVVSNPGNETDQIMEKILEEGLRMLGEKVEVPRRLHVLEFSVSQKENTVVANLAIGVDHLYDYESDDQDEWGDEYDQEEWSDEGDQEECSDEDNQEQWSDEDDQEDKMDFEGNENKEDGCDEDQMEETVTDENDYDMLLVGNKNMKEKQKSHIEENDQLD